MTTQTKSALPDVHSVVTNQFIKQLEKGVIPWHVRWTEHPFLINGWPVDHINVWLLADLNYSRNVFLNALQMTRLKAKKKDRGEKGHKIVRIRHGSLRPTLYCSEVYNVEQLEGFHDDEIPPRRVISSPTSECATVVKQMPKFPKIKWDCHSPTYYSLKTDTITMPTEEYFNNVIQYYSSLFYALAESTAHEKRRNRTLAVHRELADPKIYSCEELITEMTASYLCSYTGITPWYLTTYHNNADRWLRRLLTDSTLVLTAAMYAQEAVNYILNRSQLKNLIQTGVYIPERQKQHLLT